MCVLHVEFIEVSHSSVCKHGLFTGEHVHKNIIHNTVTLNCIYVYIHMYVHTHIMHIRTQYTYMCTCKYIM